MPVMRSKTTIDAAGRLVIPKPIRDELRLHAGDEVELVSQRDTIIITPAHREPTLIKEEGVWVYRSGEPAKVSVSELIEQDRKDRHRELLG
jgi:AbrB family looped-hinge helix DNA binding protein